MQIELTDLDSLAAVTFINSLCSRLMSTLLGEVIMPVSLLPPFYTDQLLFFSREANRKSLKWFSFVKVVAKHGDVPININKANGRVENREYHGCVF